jgi:type 1 glutamine amidotransferase
MAFTVRDSGKGRVFHCPLGHNTNALKSKGTRQLYQQATAWTTGL